MKARKMAVGTVLLFVLASGCASQVDLTAVSALARTAEPKVSVDLRDILTP